jgi:hypothetical protein
LEPLRWNKIPLLADEVFDFLLGLQRDESGDKNCFSRDILTVWKKKILTV